MPFTMRYQRFVSLSSSREAQSICDSRIDHGKQIHAAGNHDSAIDRTESVLMAPTFSRIQHATRTEL